MSSLNRIFKSIGEKIKARRQELKMTQSQVCEIILCDKRYYQKIEAGRAYITIPTLHKIAQALKVEVNVSIIPDEEK